MNKVRWYALGAALLAVTISLIYFYVRGHFWLTPREPIGDIRYVASCVKTYREVFGIYPTGNNREVTRKLLQDRIGDRISLRAMNNLSGVKDGKIVDKWGREVKIESHETSFKILSAGSNGIFDDWDDIQIELN